MRFYHLMRSGWIVANARFRDKDAWLPVLFDECQKLGGIYIKFLQQLATSELASVQLKSYARHMAVFDDVTHDPIDVQERVRTELGYQAERLILLGDAPFASGSFAQIYAAELDGVPVVVKVQHETIANWLKFDTAFLIGICTILQPLMRTSLLDLPALAREFTASTKRETDYKREAHVAEELRSYFELRRSPVFIPKTYRELSTKTLLVQERVFGLSLTDVIKQTQRGIDPVEYVQHTLGTDLRDQLSNMGGELLSSIVFADYIMADPHPGNILLLANGRTAFIDFGLSVEAPRRRMPYTKMIAAYRELYEDRADMGSLAIAMMAFFDYELYEALTVFAGGSTITSSVESFISTDADERDLAHDALATQRRIMHLFLERINEGNRFAIHIDEREIVLQNAMRSFVGSAGLAFGDENRTKYFYPAMRHALVMADNEIIERGVQDAVARQRMSLERAREIVTDWLGDIAAKDSQIYMSIMKEAKI